MRLSLLSWVQCQHYQDATVFIFIFSSRSLMTPFCPRNRWCIESTPIHASLLGCFDQVASIYYVPKPDRLNDEQITFFHLRAIQPTCRNKSVYQEIILPFIIFQLGWLLIALFQIFLTNINAVNQSAHIQ